MKMINASFPAGGLTSSFQDQQLSEYIQIKHRSAGPSRVKKAVQHVGKQDQSLWVMGPDVHIDSLGNLIDKNNSPYVWIGHLYSGPGVAPQATACNINLPLSVEPLSLMLEGLKQIMQHNYYPSLIYGIGCLHYGFSLPDHTGQVWQLPNPYNFWTTWNWQNYCTTLWSFNDGYRRKSILV